MVGSFICRVRAHLGGHRFPMEENYESFVWEDKISSTPDDRALLLKLLVCGAQLSLDV
jgi:hypothetical protein